MTTVTKNKQLTVPRATAWQVLQDLGAVYRYNPFVKSAEMISDRKCGVGARRKCVHHDGTETLEVVTGWVEGRSMDIAITESALPVTSAWAHLSLSDVRGQALVTMTVNYVPRWGVIGQLLDSMLLRDKLGERLETMLDGLDRYLATLAVTGPAHAVA